LDGIGAWRCRLATDLSRITTARGHNAGLTTCWRSHHRAGRRIRWEQRRHDDAYYKRRRCTK
jgi:hypothetical protein